MKKLISFIFIIAVMLSLAGCSELDRESRRTHIASSNLMKNQSTPTDIDYSLERYNLIRRAYWVNGQREKAKNVECPIEKPFGHIVLFSNNVVVGKFIVDGKVSSLNSFLTPDSEVYGSSHGVIDWLADVDGSFGKNDEGIFFFTVDGKYVEWTGDYLYTDIPIEIENPILKMQSNP